MTREEKEGGLDRLAGKCKKDEVSQMYRDQLNAESSRI